MRKLLLSLLLIFSVSFFGQKKDSLSIDTASLSAISRSLDSSFQRYTDSVNKEMIKQQTQQSIDFFRQMQQERNAKEKRNAIIRLAMGLVLIAVFIAGILRKRKAKK
jgi:NhaP-type Na+/H+ or K+/H+ antiporter